MEKNIELLERIAATQLIILANQLKAIDEDKGKTSTSDYISEAAKLISKKEDLILQKIRHT